MFDRTSIETCLLVTYKDCMRDKLTECFMKVLKNLKALERWAGRGLGEMSQIHEKHKRLPIIDSLIATVLKTLNKNGKKLASSAKEE